MYNLKILLEVSNEVTFPSFSSASSLDDIVPVDEVRTILAMSPKISAFESVYNAYCHLWSRVLVWISVKL